MTYIHGKSLIRLAVVDDHVLMRETLCSVINGWENCKVMLQAENGKQFLDLLDPNNLPDLVIMDLSMQGMNGYETIIAAKKIYPEMKFMVLSMYNSNEVVLQLINLGVRGFYHKGGQSTTFKKAIYEMMHTGYYFADHAASRLMKLALESDKLILKYDLSEEELIFLQNIVTEKTYNEIADGMGISLRHAEYLRDKMFGRFDTLNRIGLAITVIKKGLVV